MLFLDILNQVNKTSEELTSNGNSVDSLFWILCGFVGVTLILKLIEYFIEQRYNDHSRTTNSVITKKNSKTFDINKYKNYVGIEIECFQPYEVTLNRDFLRKYSFNSGRDGSLDSESGNGREYRNVPANGDKLFKMIDGFTSKLNEKNYFVNTSCGLHVHIETKPDLEMIQKLYCFYSKFEKHFFKMLPKSRQKNEYCQRFSELDSYSWTKVLKKKNLREFKQLFYSRLFPAKRVDYGSRKRYCWINFHSIFYRGTLEIRAHSGTLNSDKIKNWILIHLRIREFLEQNSLGKIKKIRAGKKKFLSLFDEPLQKYIKKRWSKFPDTLEINFLENKSKESTSKIGEKK